jgi:hypothetical protein
LGKGKGGRGGVNHGPNQGEKKNRGERRDKRGRFPSSLSHGHILREKRRKSKKGQG